MKETLNENKKIHGDSADGKVTASDAQITLD